MENTKQRVIERFFNQLNKKNFLKPPTRWLTPSSDSQKENVKIEKFNNEMSNVIFSRLQKNHKDLSQIFQ